MSATHEFLPQSSREQIPRRKAARPGRAAVGAAGREPSTGESVAGEPLEATSQAQFARAFGHDFSRVRVHTDDEAAHRTRAHGAAAMTTGQDIAFAPGAYRPHTPEGRSLLAHELVHVVQHSASVGGNGGHASGPDLEREAEAAADRTARTGSRVPRLAVALRAASGRVLCQKLGTRVSDPPGTKSRFRRMTATFDGREFVLSGDGTEVLRVPAQSGRPVSVRAKDAASCRGSTDESYLNNPRYVGIKNFGPIPEGVFRFQRTQAMTFSLAERARMIAGGSYTDPFGGSLHGGDWGTGRVVLTPVRIEAARSGCGSTRARSGFYLHGGSLPGSSGCIDIGNSGMDSVLDLTKGFTGAVTVTVKYAHPAPEVGAAERATGRFTYPGPEDPSLWDRVKAVFSPAED